MTVSSPVERIRDPLGFNLVKSELRYGQAGVGPERVRWVRGSVVGVPADVEGRGW